MMNAEFDPQIVPKNNRDISGIEEKVINFYRRGDTIKSRKCKIKMDN